MQNHLTNIYSFLVITHKYFAIGTYFEVQLITWAMVHDQVVEWAGHFRLGKPKYCTGTSQALHYSWRLLESHVGIKYVFPVGSSGTVGRQHKRGSRSHTVQLFPASHNPVLLTVHGRRLQHPAEDTLFHMASSSEAPSLKLACSPSLFSAMMELANSSQCCTEAQLSREIGLKPKCWFYMPKEELLWTLYLISRLEPEPLSVLPQLCAADSFSLSEHLACM